MFIRRILALLVGALLIATTAPAVAATPASAGEDDTKTVQALALDVDPLEPFARLQIGRGSELVFYMILAVPDSPERSDGDDRQAQIEAVDPEREGSSIFQGIGIAQYIPAGGMDPATVRELRGANPHELFYALSARGSEVPGVLREVHGNRFGNQLQGWALAKIKPFVFGLFSCEITEQSFANAVAGTGLPYTYNELSKGPHNWPFWYVEDPNALFPTYYTNNGLGTTGDAYYRVMFCDEDAMFINSSVNVRLAYTETGKNGVLSSGELSWQLDNAGDQMSFMSWPFDSDLAGDNSWFWMLTVEHVHHNDTLHIGTAWS